ncbi:MAG: flagellar basal body-associated protein FliL [Paracoccaceae bacterium]
MSDEQANAGAEDEKPPKKKSKAMLFGLIGAILLGGGTFYGVFSGLVPLPFGESASAESDQVDSQGHALDSGKGDDLETEHRAMTPAAYIALDPLVISLGPDARSRHLKMVVSVEVLVESESEVSAVKPRILDVLNTFLRAVDERDFETPRAMLRLRAQMLRRVQLVTPQNSVRDLLIQEFVLN